MPREDPLQGAIRELTEETAIREARFNWGLDFRETAPYARGKVARYYLARIPRPDVRILPNPLSGIIEHHEFRWMSYERARKAVAERVKPILDWAHAQVMRHAGQKDYPGRKRRIA